MTSSTPRPIALGRFRQLPQRSNEIWQGGLVRLPVWVDNPKDPDGLPYRPTGALWVSLRTGLLHVALPGEDEVVDAEFALKALIDFGLKEAKRLGGRPSIVQIRDAHLAGQVSATMSALNTSVAVVEEMPAVAEALQSLEAAANGGRRYSGMLEGTGVTVDQLRAFADAAAAFFRAAPWRHLTNEDLVVANAPQIPKAMRHVCILGNGGEQFGIAFFESRQAFERIYSRTGYLPRRAVGVTYGPLDDLPFADVDLWEDLNLAVAHLHAYPLAADLASDGTMRRLNAKELTAAEALLRALAQTTGDELDSGTWRHEVTTSAGVVTLELSLPLLLDEENGKPSASKLAVMPRLAERAGVRTARLFGDQTFENDDDASAAIARGEAGLLFEHDAEGAAGHSLNALEQAQELAYDAMEATGRLKIKLARRALALSADCADAYVILGDAGASPQEACEWYERGVDAGARAIGPDTFAAVQGEFWDHLETRPYMRARNALAQTLRELGREEEALTHYRELLRLNPNDNQGVRYVLLPMLLELRRDEEADRLIQAYDGDIHATWAYSRALRAFQVHGDGSAARAALERAIRVNRHVVGYLIDADSIPSVSAPHFALGSKEEAASVAEEIATAFEVTPGARSWLGAMAGRRDARLGHRRPAKRRRPR